MSYLFSFKEGKEVNWDTVHTYVLLGRYKRSGSALLSCCLDAHPNIIFPRNELLFEKYKKYETKERMYEHLWNQSKKFRGGRTFSANGYKYPIKGAGRCDEPRVIGHKSSTRAYMKLDEPTLKDFNRFTDADMVMLFLARNPFHLISERWMQKEWRRKNAPVGPIIDDIINVSRKHEEILDLMPHQYICYEDLVHPKCTEALLKGIARVLQVPAPKSWLDSCKELIHEDDAHTTEPPWTKADIDRVYKELVEEYWFFNGYRFKQT